MSVRILIPQPVSRSLLRWLPPRRTWQQQHRRNTQQAQRPQTIETCPSPSCACQDMPSLDIERDKPLDGTMAAYHEHVVIPTGRVDWTSRIEEDPHLPLVKELKDSLGPKGRYSNPFHNVLITTSSHPTPPTTSSTPQATSAFLFPSFLHLPSIQQNSSLADFIQGAVLPARLSPHTTSNLPSSATEHLKRDPSLSPPARLITDIHILICGHGERDSRCGILGPILQREFEEKLRKTESRYMLRDSADEGEVDIKDAEEVSNPTVRSRVHQISHIGGHKFAGNVIVYIPPVLGNQGHPLAGQGVWYGRVEPKHVEGIVSETVEGGRVIKELFRGGIDGKGGLMRI